MYALELSFKGMFSEGLGKGGMGGGGMLVFVALAA